MIPRLLRPVEAVDGGAYPAISEEKLLFLGGIFGLTPSIISGGSGQSLADAAQALRPPDFGAGAELIECELFAPEDSANSI